MTDDPVTETIDPEPTPTPEPAEEPEETPRNDAVPDDD